MENKCETATNGKVGIHFTFYHLGIIMLKKKKKKTKKKGKKDIY